MTYADELDRQIAFTEAMVWRAAEMDMAESWRLIQGLIRQTNERERQRNLRQRFNRLNVYPPPDESGWTEAEWWKQ